MKSDSAAVAPVIPWYAKVFGGVVNWHVRMMYVLYTMCLEFPITAISLVIMREMDYTPEEVMRYYLLTYTPWMLKPVYAFVSDMFPILGYRRKPYILISAALSSVIFLAMSVTTSRIGFRNLAVVSSLLNCIGEVMLDGLMTEFGNKLKKECKIRDKYFPNGLTAESENDTNVPDNAAPLLEDEVLEEENISDSDAERILAEELSRALPDFLTRANARAVVQSECMTIRSTASVVAALLSMGVMAFTEKARIVIFITAVIPAVICFSALIFPEKRLPSTSHLRYNCCDKVIKDYTDSRAASALASQIKADHEAAAAAINSSNTSAVMNLVSYPSSEFDTNESTYVAPTPTYHEDGPAEETQRLTTATQDEESFTRIIIGAVWLRVKLIIRAIIVLFRPVLFVFIVNTMPKYATPWYSFLYSEFTFPGWLLTGFTLVSLSGALVGSLLYLRVFSRIPLDKVFFVSNILDVLATLPLLLAAAKLHTKWLGIPDVVFIPVISFIDAIFGRIALMPSLVLAAESCPPQLGLESTMFSLFTSVSYLASLSSYAIQVAMTRYFNLDGEDFTSLPSYIGVCLACQLIPLLCLQVLPSGDHDHVETEAEAAVSEAEEGKRMAREVLRKREAMKTQPSLRSRAAATASN